MDTRTGDIYTGKTFEEMLRSGGIKPEEHRFFTGKVKVSMLGPGKRAELAKTGHTKVGRNDLCPCGSGKKFKKCCLRT